MRLHHHPASPYARKARVALLEREEPHDLVAVDVRGGGLRDPAFLALSPFGKMPVLEAPGGAIFESTSIVDYLEDRGPRCLLPRGTERVARHWDRIGDLYVIEPLSVLWFQPGHPDTDELTRTIRTAWGLMEDRLLGRHYLAGELFTLADLGAAIGTDNLTMLDLTPPPRVAAWLERIRARPAFARVRDDALPVLERMRAARGG